MVLKTLNIVHGRKKVEFNLELKLDIHSVEYCAPIEKNQVDLEVFT